MSDGSLNRTFVHQSFGPRPQLRGSNRRNLPNRSYAQGYGPTGSTRVSAISATYFLIALNTGVFAGWAYAQATKDQRLLRTLRENFTLSWQNWREGRQWTILTSAFSHKNFIHFAFNMLTFSTFGTMLSWVPGIGAFHVLALSLGSGLAGSIAWLYQKQRPSESGAGKILGPFGQTGDAVRQSALGASGMVVGAGAAAACLMPWAQTSTFQRNHRNHQLSSASSRPRRPPPCTNNPAKLSWQHTVMPKKRRPAMPVSNAIGFDDLAPEIRNEIYRLTVCSIKPLDISDVDIRNTPPRKLLIAQTTGRRPRLITNLLRTSHQICAEAASILYGENTFEFPSEKPLYTFLETIGSSRKHLRHIRFGLIGDRAKLCSALCLLAQANNLDSFECWFGTGTPLFWSDNDTQAMLPWLKALQDRANAAAGRKEALEIFKFEEFPLSPLTPWNTGPDQARRAARYKQWHSDVIASLRRALGSQ
ncbi:hypothetical protein LTR01_004747 [Friedmanniomyces endolithicus]|nr:hypothetical protein LTR01_004747 [Friedmanniomyces endolithicus]KAK0829880.1 hypothetical protein LTR73_004017 [Friedmanniomyces endolithicus]